MLPVAKLWSIATILVVGLAGLIHLSLIREHFEEQFVYGLVFTILALFQFNLALLLAVRPGPAVYRLGIWCSGLIVLVYVATRLIPLPGASVPEEVDALGIAATGLELVAVLLLAAPFAALLSAVLLSLSLVFLRFRGARATCMPGDLKGAGVSCDVGEGKEQGDAALVPGNHPGRRMI